MALPSAMSLAFQPNLSLDLSARSSQVSEWVNTKMKMDRPTPWAMISLACGRTTLL